ncbi:MAG: formimidoylglutamate deiminase [Solirubrobacteraceae bacterium]
MSSGAAVRQTTEITGMPNVHSHAFQRAMRTRAERLAPDRDDFWTWRTVMFEVAAGLDPDSMRTVAAQAYGEMAAAGYGAVGEFHYIHHQPDGTPYADPNEMAKAVAEAAIGAGLPIVLLPAAYHRNGWDNGDRPPAGGQRRFCDPDVDSFLQRVDTLRAWAAKQQGVSVGVAAHSTRALPRDWLAAIATYAQAHGLVRHVHAHEQRRELDECQAEHGCSPLELLEDTGFLSPLTTVIHGVHVSDADIERIRRSGAIVASCPTTEGNLGDGYFPAMRYQSAGVRIAVGSDSQARLDPFEEARELETLSRRERQLRSGLLAALGDLWEHLCVAGASALGLQRDALRRVTINLEHPDLLGVAASDVSLALVTACSAAVVVAS